MIIDLSLPSYYVHQPGLRNTALACGVVILGLLLGGRGLAENGLACVEGLLQTHLSILFSNKALGMFRSVYTHESWEGSRNWTE